MGYFYPPPPSSQGPVNSTQPIPHDPIPAQGDDPPRRQVGAVLAMVAVLASWPADLEPRLQAPNNTRTAIAPLTLAYGQSPPFTRQGQAPLWVAWADAEPRPPRPQTTVFPGVVVAVPYVPPGPTGAIYPAILQAHVPIVVQVVQTWVSVPDNPDQPPRVGTQASTRQALLSAAWTQTWDAQRSFQSLAWVVPPLLAGVVPYVRLPRHLWTAWLPFDVPGPDALMIAALIPPPVVVSGVYVRRTMFWRAGNRGTRRS